MSCRLSNNLVVIFIVQALGGVTELAEPLEGVIYEAVSPLRGRMIVRMLRGAVT